MAKSGGGSTTQIQDVPPEFKPAYYRMFNSAFGAAQQAAANPFGAAPMQGQVPQGQVPPGAAPPGAAPTAAPPPGGLFPGQFPTAPVQGASRGTSQLGGPGFSFRPAPGRVATPEEAFAQNLPTGFTGGSPNIPLSGGPPIIGQPFPGQFTAPTTPIELESLLAREAVGRQLGGLGSPLLQLGQQQAMGQFLSPESNPFFAANLEASLQPAFDYFTRGVAPQFGSQALQSGAFRGSSARDMAFSNLANDFGRNLLQTAAQTGMQNYLQERQIQQQTPQLLQQAAGLQQLSPEILAQVGAGQREVLQRPLDELLLQFQEAQQAPFRPLGPLASIIQGSNIGTTQTITPPRPSPLAAGIAGGLGGGALGLAAGNQLFPNNQLGAGGLGGLGALLGGLAGGLG